MVCKFYAITMFCYVKKLVYAMIQQKGIVYC